jgi:catechol 2,3-dioxygenase-like lactoylglutathione lyase family enzyme
MKTNRRDFIQGSAMALVGAMHGTDLLFGKTAHAAESPPNGPVMLKKLRLRSNDLDAQETFYRDVLGLPVNRPNEDLLIVTTGVSEIEFVPDAESENPFYHFAFTIPENLLEKSLEWLTPRCDVLDVTPRGAKIRHFQHWNAHSIFFLDPVGNILEFIAHHDLKNGTDQPFGPDQILFTSEIGLVVPDVPAVAGSIEKQFGHTPFRGLSSKGFTAMGDMSGLVLVVKEGRGWIPLTVKSQVFPTEVILGHGSDVKEFVPKGLPYSIQFG